MKYILHFVLADIIFILFFGCQETEQKVIQKTTQNAKNTIKKTIVPRKKITFGDIKDKFLHKNLKLVPSPKDTNFYQLVSVSYGFIKTPHDLTEQDIDDLGLTKVYKNYKEFKRGKYFAYSLHNIQQDYFIGIADGGEYMTSIVYFWLGDKGKNPIFMFSINSEGDGGRAKKDFAIFYEGYIDIHLLFTHSPSKFLEYKNYKLKWEKRNKLKADTLTNIKQKNTDLKFFERILKKYGY